LDTSTGPNRTTCDTRRTGYADPTTTTHRRGEHFADAERLLAALPLVKRGADRDRDVQVAARHATLAIAAILADEDGHTGR
jgi:hypothetical protein